MLIPLVFHEYTDVVNWYIDFCQKVCVPSRRVNVFSNGKLWFTPGLRTKLKAKEESFKNGDRASYEKAKYDVQKAVRGAKSTAEGSRKTSSQWTMHGLFAGLAVSFQRQEVQCCCL